MKVWRVISLILWGIVLTMLLLVSGIHFLLTYTVLDQSKATATLEQTSFYSALRTQVFLPAIEKQLPADITGGAVVRSADIRTVIDDVFTTNNVQTISGQITDATYNWLDKKTPTLEFTVPISNEKQAFLDKLRARVTQNVAALPICDSYADISSNPATATCLPPYTSRAAAVEEVMNEITNMLRTTPNTITAETVGLTPREMRHATNLPDYLGYLWALNLITLPLALIISLYLLLKRRGGGLITISATILVLGIIALCGTVAFQNANILSSTDALGGEMVKAARLLVVPTLTLAGTIGVGTGIVGIIGGIFWQRNRSD